MVTKGVVSQSLTEGYDEVKKEPDNFQVEITLLNTRPWS